MSWFVPVNKEMGDAFPAMMWAAGPDRACRWVNRRWLEFTGRSAAEVTGDGWAADIHPDDLARWREAYRAAFASHQGFSLEYRLRRHDGPYRTVLEQAGPGFENGRPAGRYLGFCIDATHLAGDPGERERLMAQACAANRMRDDFISLVSHGMRTPLNTIMMSAQLLQISLPDDLEVREAAATIVDCVKSQSRLLDELVDTCRVISGQAELVLADVDLAELADVAVQSAAAAAAEKGVSLTQAIEVRPAGLRGDPARLGRMLANLLSNAVKFTPAGGAVTLKLDRWNDHYRIAVRDTGQGIAPEALALVFDPSRPREPTNRRMKKSLGLGLAVVRKIARMHGGEAEAHSAGPGQGATFVVRLPAGRAAGEM